LTIRIATIVNDKSVVRDIADIYLRCASLQVKNQFKLYDENGDGRLNREAPLQPNQIFDNLRRICEKSSS
jgi:hypothetical protein